MSARFSAVPRAAIEDASLTQNDLLVLMALGCFTDEHGWCWPSQSTLAKKARVHRNTVTGSIRNLVRLGYVEVYKPDNGDLSKIRYRVILDTARAPEEIVTPSVAPLALEEGKGLASGTGKLARVDSKLAAAAVKPCPPDGHKQEPTNKTKEQDPAVASLFEEVWGAWARKLKAEKHAGRGEGKAKTLEIFRRKAGKADPALIRSLALDHVRRSDGFLEGLSVWLNKERYDTGDNVVSIDAAPNWQDRLFVFEAFDRWEEDWGPKPGQVGCRAPQPEGLLL